MPLLEKLLSQLEWNRQKIAQLSRRLDKYREESQQILDQIESLKNDSNKDIETAEPPEPPSTLSINDCLIISTGDRFIPWQEQGGVLLQRPEAAYKAMRQGELQPEICVVDLSCIPSGLQRSVDLRIRCPKIWIGKTAPNPGSVTSLGLYQARSSLTQLYENAQTLFAMSQGIMSPKSAKVESPIPVITQDIGYRKQLEEFSAILKKHHSVLIKTDDRLEQLAVAYYLSMNCDRHRIWEVNSKSALQSALKRTNKVRKVSDVSMVLHPKLSHDFTYDSKPKLREGCGAIYLCQQTCDLGLPILEVPSLQTRPTDITHWIVWFLARLSIKYGVAIVNLEELIENCSQDLESQVDITDIELKCERILKAQILSEQELVFQSYEDQIRNYERQVLQKALTENSGNILATARALGLAESSLRYKLQILGVKRKLPTQKSETASS